MNSGPTLHIVHNLSPQLAILPPSLTLEHGQEFTCSYLRTISQLMTTQSTVETDRFVSTKKWTIEGLH